MSILPYLMFFNYGGGEGNNVYALCAGDVQVNNYRMYKLYMLRRIIFCLVGVFCSFGESMQVFVLRTGDVRLHAF